MRSAICLSGWTSDHSGSAKDRVPVCSLTVKRNALRPLPAEPFDMVLWSYARVNVDYHMAFDANLFSAPDTLGARMREVCSAQFTMREGVHSRDPFNKLCRVRSED